MIERQNIVNNAQLLTKAQKQVGDMRLKWNFD